MPNILPKTNTLRGTSSKTVSKSYSKSPSPSKTAKYGYKYNVQSKPENKRIITTLDTYVLTSGSKRNKTICTHNKYIRT